MSYVTHQHHCLSVWRHGPINAIVSTALHWLPVTLTTKCFSWEVYQWEISYRLWVNFIYSTSPSYTTYTTLLLTISSTHIRPISFINGRYLKIRLWSEMVHCSRWTSCLNCKFIKTLLKLDQLIMCVTLKLWMVSCYFSVTSIRSAHRSQLPCRAGGGDVLLMLTNGGAHGIAPVSLRPTDRWAGYTR